MIFGLGGWYSVGLNFLIDLYILSEKSNFYLIVVYNLFVV